MQCKHNTLQYGMLQQKCFRVKILFFEIFKIKIFIIEPYGKISLMCYNKIRS